MAKYRMIHVAFWEDARVLEEMTPEDKYFYMYLMTNPSTKQIGIYQITKKKIAFETGYSIETVNALMDRFEKFHMLIKYNKETREIALLNWPKYNLTHGGKPILDCVRAELRDVKDVQFISDLIVSVPNDSIKNLFLAYVPQVVDEPYHDPLATRGEKEKEKEKENKKENEKQQGKDETKIVEISAFQFYEKNGFGALTPYVGEKVNAWIEDLSEELIIHAMEISIENGVLKWKYVESILKDWANKKIKSIEEVNAIELQRKQQQLQQQPYQRKLQKVEKVPDWLAAQKANRATGNVIVDSVTPEYEEERRLLLEKLGITQ